MKKIKNDLFLILGIAVVGIGLLIGWFFYVRNRGSYAEIYHGDELLLTVSLSEDKTYQVTGDVSEMTIVVENHKIWVEESGCPNHLCMEMGKKSKENETITCLPNKVYIKITGGKSE